ncbi:MAG: anhydro-N-acetylmuramic acid kinase [Gammaproteobacteria bacterium]
MAREWYLGLMSGTSADALDLVLVDCSREMPLVLDSASVPFTEALKTDMRILRTESAGELARYGLFDRSLAHFCSDQILDLVGHKIDKVNAVGWAGHTVRHSPASRHAFSLQAGDAATIAQRTQLPVVSDFRRCHIAAGGEGAPLAPIFHRAFFRNKDQAEPVAVLNLGGIANLSILPASGPAIGSDLGPANCLLDEWAQLHLGESCDIGGQWAQSGRVIAPLLQEMLSDPWFALPWPKSTGREYFHLQWLEACIERAAAASGDQSFPPEDVQCTLVALVMRNLRNALSEHGETCQKVVVCGGGSRNQFLMHRLQLGCAVSAVLTDDKGLDSEWVEAAGIAWLAGQRLNGSLVELHTSNVPKKGLLGVVYYPTRPDTP